MKILSTVLGLLSLIVLFSNYHLFWRQIKAKPEENVPSMIPIVGGLLGFFALRFSPLSGYAWLAPLLDPGCYLIYFLVMIPIWKLRRK